MRFLDECLIQGTHHLGRNCRPNLVTLRKTDTIYQERLNILVEYCSIFS